MTLIAIAFQSCNVGGSGTWKDENIDLELKTEIAALDKQVLNAVFNNSPESLKKVMSDELRKKTDDNIRQMIEKVSGAVQGANYEILNQYYVENSTTGVGNTVMSGISGADDYIISYKAVNKEMFVSLILLKNELDELLVTNVYGKYPEGWKLNILQFGQYRLNGNNAPQFYEMAKADYEKGYLIDAANHMFLSSQLANPANKFWKYQKEGEMRHFYETLMSEVKGKYTFPLAMDNIESQPQILSVYLQRTQEGYFPMVEYLTQIDIQDTVKTKEENDKIHQSIGQVFNGLDKDKAYLFYKAFSEMPNGQTPVSTYGFVKELK